MSLQLFLRTSYIHGRQRESLAMLQGILNMAFQAVIEPAPSPLDGQTFGA